MGRLALLAACCLALAACAPEGEVVVDDFASPTPTPVEAPEPTPTPSPTPAGEPEQVDDPLPPEALPTDAWTRLADAPVALTEVAAAPFAGDVWVAGGFTSAGQPSDAVLVYDPTFDIWQQGPPLPEPVHHAALVSTGDELLLIGGYSGPGFGAPTAQVWRLDAAEGEWTQGPALPEPRGAGAAAFDGSRVVYGGGVGPDGLAGEVRVLEGGQWRDLGELSEPREHLAAASDGQGRVWFLAGRTGGLDTNLTAVDLVEGEEVRRLGDVPTARGGVAAFYFPGVGGCVAGGEEPTSTFAEVECVDADGAVTELPALGHARHGLGAAVVDGVAYVVLGGPEPRLAVSVTIEALPLD